MVRLVHNDEVEEILRRLALVPVVGRADGVRQRCHDLVRLERGPIVGSPRHLEHGGPSGDFRQHTQSLQLGVGPELFDELSADGPGGGEDEDSAGAA